MLSDYFEVSRRIFQAGERLLFSISGRYFQQNMSDLSKKGKLRLCIIPDHGIFPDGTLMTRGDFRECKLSFVGDKVAVEYEALEEGEYYLRLELLTQDNGAAQNIEVLCDFEIYVLNDDLYKLRPFKGDMHVHTSYSFCGKSTDAPEFVCATAREKGLDFIAMTDHMQTESAESVADFGCRYGSEFKVYRGEECHMLPHKLDTRFWQPDFVKHIHIVNFGSSIAVCKYINEHFDEVDARINAAADRIKLDCSHDTRYLMAAADWMCDKIHEGGGIAVFCHPFWRNKKMTNLPYPVREYMLSQGKYDVMEIIGLALPLNDPKRRELTEANNLAVAWWQQACINQNRMIPVVGNTDTHDAGNVLGLNYTIVLAAENSFESLKEALLKGRAVAVTNSGDQAASPQIYGDVRLVRYVHYLLRNFYAEHDELCCIEGKTIRAMLRKNIKTADIGSIETISDYMKRFFEAE